MNTDDMETVGIEPTEGSRHRADRVERLRIVSDGTPRSTRVTREGSDEVLMVTGFVLSQPDPGSPLTGSVDVLVPSVDVVADCKVRETSMERERVYAELDRLYLLLALFDRRDGTYIADLVRSAREGFERSAPDMAEDDAWGEFDRLWARRDSAAAVVPVTPTTENPEAVTLAFWECGHVEVDRGVEHPCDRDVCSATYASYAPVVAGRAAATPDPPDGSRVAVTDAEFENGVRCVTMPCCAFTFDADHTDQDGKTYTCPLCSPAASPTAPPPPRTLSEIAAGVPPPGGRDWKTPWDAEGDT